MSISSEYREGFQTCKPIKCRNAERVRAMYVHSFTREGYINIETHSTLLQELQNLSLQLKQPLCRPCGSAGCFCQLFVHFHM